ncbi:hypothetical protein QZM15_16245 [Burkholderia sp. AU44665]|uniref:hypothetical protein n=1 Tax=Burkholderia sp. AU44665 TaxID=3059203 RepID=UPI00265EA790|nr:hypothetical protein [Burkholderia sp. AU44665]MDN7700022.1 hypothetical protein [Burkholderia sp. AU44665]
MDQYQQCTIKESLWQAQQRASVNNLGGLAIQGGLASQCAEQQLNYPHLNTPPMPNTVRSLTEQAHIALGVLESEITRLADTLQPVREPMPSPEPTGCKQASIAPPCIHQLQSLIARIENQMRWVRQIAEELRV